MNIKDKIAGFEISNIRPLDELDGRLVELVHEQSGMEVCFVDRPSENKTFCITFTTIPEDDTGVFHILEHSVLCGSEKYTVKEPFLEALKASLNTFLNAFTGSDKTMYPVCSRNEKDFFNLMGIYLDAVFCPAIHFKDEIFRQEGWHYEFDEQGEPSYKGVVYNEMKGAYASADSIAYYETQKRLFPNSCYRFSSGGDPEFIPQLTLESFRQTHRRFYHPSNAKVFLDGTMDIAQALELLNQYASGYERLNELTMPKHQQPVRTALETVYYELAPEERLQNKAKLVMGFVAGEYDDILLNNAAQVLCDVLCGNNEAPLTRKLLDEGLCSSVSLYVEDSSLQPNGLMTVEDIDEAKVQQVQDVIFGELERLSKEGLDREQIKASMANMEFRRRQRDYGSFPEGLFLALNAIGSWAYGGDPIDKMQVGDTFDKLNAFMNEGGFEKLIDRLFLSNEHSCMLLMLPSHTLGDEIRQGEQQRLKQACSLWSAAEREELLRQQQALLDWQNTDDTPEQLATMPRLELKDIATAPQPIPTEEKNINGIRVLLHSLPTAGVVYCNLYFDAEDYDENELKKLSLFCSLLGNLATDKRSASKVKTDEKFLFGGFRFITDIFASKQGPSHCPIKCTVGFSALETKLSEALQFMLELMIHTVFDKDRVKEQIKQTRNALMMGLVESGHSVAMLRAGAAFSSGSVANDCTEGYEHYQWIKDLDDNFEARWDELKKDLQAMAGRIYQTSRLTLSVTGNVALAETISKQLACALERGEGCKGYALIPRGAVKEGIIVPGDVAYLGLSINLAAQGYSYDGRLAVLGNILSLAHLWNAIRVKGGAYGGGFSIRSVGLASTYSYRDPDPMNALNSSLACADFMQEFCKNEPDLTGFIIGAVANGDPLLTPRTMGAVADSRYFSSITDQDRAEFRKQLLGCTTQGLLELTALLKNALQDVSYCIVGAQPKLDACAEVIDCTLSL